MRVVESASLMYVIMSIELSLSQKIDFSFSLKHQIGHHLVNKRFRKFVKAMETYLSGPDGDCLTDKNSYEIIMQELLLPLHQSFVILESVLADHILIPQCRRHYDRAFLLEYKVIRNKLLGLDLQEQLKIKAQYALDKINQKKYETFVENFHHVKEIVKIGLAFYNRSKVSMTRQIENINSDSTSGETNEMANSQYVEYEDSEWE